SRLFQRLRSRVPPHLRPVHRRNGEGFHARGPSASSCQSRTSRTSTRSRRHPIDRTGTPGRGLNVDPLGPLQPAVFLLHTYTQMKEPDHRWGQNGGNDRWQHDLYNAGAMVEAGVHFYRATGKTKLLEVATRIA